MKVIIKLLDTTQGQPVLTILAQYILQRPGIAKSITAHGLAFEELSPKEIGIFESRLKQTGYTGYEVLETSVVFKSKPNDFQAMLGAVWSMLRPEYTQAHANSIAHLFWSGNLVLQKMSEKDAMDLQKALSATKVQVTLVDTRSFRIDGVVREQSSNEPVDDAAIELGFWSEGVLLRTRKAVTKQKGGFRIVWRAEWFQNVKNKQAVKLVFKVSKEEIKPETKASLDNLAWQHQKVDLWVEKEKQEQEEPQSEGTFYTVCGNIYQSDGRALPGVLVRAYHRDMRSEEFLGEQITDNDGFYLVRYYTKQYKRAEKGSADLFIRVFDANREELAASEILFNAQPDAIIDLTLSASAYSISSDCGCHQATIGASPMAPVQGIRAEDEIADPFVPRERLATIEQAVDTLAESVDRERADQWRLLLLRLKRPLPTLNLLFEYSRQFTQGNVDAGYKLLQVLNLLVSQPSGVYAFVWQGPFFPNAQPLTDVPTAGSNPVQLNIPFDWQNRGDCLFPPSRLGELFFGLSRLAGSMPQPAPGALEAYWGAVLSLVEQTAPLGMIYSSAKDIFDHRVQAVTLFRQTLDSVSHLVPASLPAASAPMFWATPNHAFPPPNEGPGFPPFPIPVPPGRTWDPCRLGHGDSTARLEPCAQALLADDRYEIDDIFNISEQVSRRACVGDRVVIRGRNLGTEGFIQVGNVYCEIIDWGDEAILFVVPAASRGQHLISLCINPNLEACSGVLVCRWGSPDSSLAMEVVYPPNIAWVNMSGATVAVLEAGRRFQAEACTDVSLTAEIPYAERVVIRDGHGEVVWESDYGEPRSINVGRGVVSLLNLRESTIYTVEASTMCEPINESVSLEIYHAIHIGGLNAYRVGVPIPITIRISCPAQEDLEVVLSSSDPSVLTVPTEPWRIPAGSSMVTGELQGHQCSEVTLLIMIAGHRTRDWSFILYDEPRVRSVSPLTVTACSNATLTIEGDCFSPYVGDDFIRLTRRSDSTQRSFPVTTIEFENPANRGRGVRTTAEIRDLLPGEWTVQVNRGGYLLGTPFEHALTVVPLPVVVNQFYSSPTTIFPCQASTVTLHWEVINAERIVLLGSEINDDIPYPDSCGVITDSRSFTIRQSQTVQLQAWPIGVGEPVSQTLSILENSPLQQVGEVIVRNPLNSLLEDHNVAIWTMADGRAPQFIATLRPGEERIINLDDCIVTTVIAVSHTKVAQYNRCHHTRISAETSSVFDIYEFRSSIGTFLGRRGYGLRVVEPLGISHNYSCYERAP